MKSMIVRSRRHPQLVVRTSWAGVALAAMLLSATRADAWSIGLEFRSDPNQAGGVQTLSCGGIDGNGCVSDLIVDVFFTADPAPSNLQAFSVGVLYDESRLVYDEFLSSALAVVYLAPPALYGTTGSQPGYIMYNPGDPFTILYPTQSPHALWGGVNQPGRRQVNLAFEDPLGLQNPGGHTNLWIGSLFFHVNGAGVGVPSHTIDLGLDPAQGNFILANDDPNAGASAILGGPLLLINIPEPSAALLVALGLLGIGARQRLRAGSSRSP
jgi:hypothetical protein